MQPDSPTPALFEVRKRLLAVALDPLVTSVPAAWPELLQAGVFSASPIMPGALQDGAGLVVDRGGMSRAWTGEVEPSGWRWLSLPLENVLTGGAGSAQVDDGARFRLAWAISRSNRSIFVYMNVGDGEATGYLEVRPERIEKVCLVSATFSTNLLPYTVMARATFDDAHLRIAHALNGETLITLEDERLMATLRAVSLTAKGVRQRLEAAREPLRRPLKAR